MALLCVGCSSWEVEFRSDIEASPEHVWQLLSDLESYPEWNSYSRRVTGRLEVGEVVIVEAHLGEEVREVENIVTRVEPQTALCWRSKDWYGALARGSRCRLLEKTRGGVQLTHHEIMEGPLAWLIERLYRPRIEQGMRQVNADLKRAAEQGA
jgi:uncharacterized protein YndB with AHSA1/START domain